MNIENRPLLKVLITSGIFLIVFLGLLISQKGYEVFKLFENKTPQNTIAISAEGKVAATPDLATVSLGVLTQGDTADGVQNESSKKINTIIDFVIKQGIDKNDINTSQFNIYPTQDYREGKSIITGYQANQTIVIKVRKVNESTNKLSTILGAVTKNGANQINGVSLSFDDPDQFRQQARELAIVKAKEKAQQLADAAGLKLGRVVSLSETPGYGGITPYYGEAYGIGGGGAGGDKGVYPNVEPGSQDIIASMTVIFELK
jgi:uncharacterized protein YggE